MLAGLARAVALQHPPLSQTRAVALRAATIETDKSVKTGARLLKSSSITTMASPIISKGPLGFPFTTQNPFLFAGEFPEASNIAAPSTFHSWETGKCAVHR